MPEIIIYQEVSCLLAHFAFNMDKLKFYGDDLIKKYKKKTAKPVSLIFNICCINGYLVAAVDND